MFMSVSASRRLAAGSQFITRQRRDIRRGIQKRDEILPLRAKGARIYAITTDEGLAEYADDAILLRAPLSEALTPISFAVSAQLVALSLAKRHGRDVERPRGLSKVTRTR